MPVPSLGFSLYPLKYHFGQLLFIPSNLNTYYCSLLPIQMAHTGLNRPQRLRPRVSSDLFVKYLRQQSQFQIERKHIDHHQLRMFSMQDQKATGQ